MSIEAFYQETEALRRATAELSRLLGTQAARDEIVDGLAAVATCLSDLSEHETRRIGTPLRASAGGPAIDRLLNLGRAQALHDDWLAFLTDWSCDCIASDFATFENEALILLERIDLTLQQANADLYPSALAKGLIRLRR